MSVRRTQSFCILHFALCILRFGDFMNEKTVYALGFFDGVHLGHASLLAACRTMAQELGCKAGVVTFSNHPDGLVRGTDPGLITTIYDRDKLLRERFGMDTVVTLPFDRAMMNTPWQDFFGKLLAEYQAAGLVCGEDFRFGYRGEGNGEKLLTACREAGIPCVVVPQQTLDDAPISSTHIRYLVEMGMMRNAVRFLGHPYVLTGKVVHGYQLGRRMGMPTANLMLPKELVVPRLGVYAGRCLVDGKYYDAVTNIGTRPTVAGIGITVETWILDEFQGDLYGKEITLEFYYFIRPEIRFPNLEALQEAVYRDAEQTREILSRISK